MYSGNLLIIQSFNPSLLLLLQSELLSSHPQPVENTTTRLLEALSAVEMSSQILHCPGLISIFFKDDLPFPQLDWILYKSEADLRIFDCYLKQILRF